MYRFGLVGSILYIFFFTAKSQSSAGYDAPSQDIVTSFKPSLALVISILAIMFSLTLILLIYSKFCYRSYSSGPPYLGDVDQENTQHVLRPDSLFSGIDKKVIESLPFFRFSALKGSKEGLECAVCLSKFEEIEILRLLPKCKHAFHINCVDQWLEKHSTCPLCRVQVSVEDPEIFAYSSSLRYLWNQSEPQDDHRDSNLQLFVQRGEDLVDGSTRFSIEGSFRRPEKGNKADDDQLHERQENVDGHRNQLSEIEKFGNDHNNKDGGRNFHRFNHTITVSDALFKTRWSSVNSLDLRLLNIEMLNSMVNETEALNIKEEVDSKRLLEKHVNINHMSSFPSHPSTSNTKTNTTHHSKSLVQADKRSMSEITSVSRLDYLSTKKQFRETCLLENDVKEEKKRQLWLSVSRRTVQWFANREKRSSLPLYTKDSLGL